MMRCGCCGATCKSTRRGFLRWRTRCLRVFVKVCVCVCVYYSTSTCVAGLYLDLLQIPQDKLKGNSGSVAEKTTPGYAGEREKVARLYYMHHVRVKYCFVSGRELYASHYAVQHTPSRLGDLGVGSEEDREGKSASCRLQISSSAYVQPGMQQEAPYIPSTMI
ncbi:hypothetical protein GGR52DRAFT_297701 [Hypoxylon sp. FL1284]|nr:hypothetical protein GGR52DRAFT_297701 [Hypoxylon sp. FL1284]